MTLSGHGRISRRPEVRGTAVVVFASLLLVVWSVVVTASRHVQQPGIAAAFLALIVVGEIVRIRLPGDREVAPLGAAGALAYALLADFGSVPTTHSAAQVVAVSAVAVLIGSVPHIVAARTPRVDEAARRVLSAALAGYLFRPLWDGGKSWIADQSTWVLAAAMLGVAVVVALADATLSAFLRADRDRAPFGTSLRDELRSVFALGLRGRRHRRTHRPGRPGHGLVGAPRLLRAPAAHPDLVPSLLGHPGRPTCRPSAPCPGSPSSAATPRPATRSASATCAWRSAVSSACARKTCSSSSTPP